MMKLCMLPLWCAMLGSMTMQDDALLLTTGRTHYRLGDTIDVTLRNDSPEPIAMNGYCGLHLYVQKRERGGWSERRSVVMELDTCMGFSVTIAPGSTASGFPRFTLREPGEYRLVAFYARPPFPEPGRLVLINAVHTVISHIVTVR